LFIATMATPAVSLIPRALRDEGRAYLAARLH